MNIGSLGAQDVLNLNTAHNQGIGNQKAVAAPGNSFGAHHGHPPNLGQLQQRLQAVGKIGGLHIVGKTLERGVAPAGIGGVGLGMAQAAEAAQVGVADAEGVQRVRQPALVELGVALRAGYGAHIYHARYSVDL